MGAVAARRPGSVIGSLSPGGGVFLILLLLLAAGAPPAGGITLTVTGNWNAGTFGTSDLAGGAGTDFRGPLQSPSSQVTITTGRTRRNWQITVGRSGSWPTGMRLWIARDGSPTWLEITSAGVLFYTGRRANVTRCTLRLQPAAAGGAGTFTLTVIYTVTEN